MDESVLLLLSKRANGVGATIYTVQITPQLQLDLQKHNAQYPPVAVKTFTRSHDRFLLIDSDVFHISFPLPLPLTRFEIPYFQRNDVQICSRSHFPKR